MSEEKIEFKPIKRKNLRKRKQSSDEETAINEDEAEIQAKLELIQETKEKQKLRNRSNGVNVATLALGKKITIEEEVTVKDPFKLQTGGMVNMQALKAGKLKTVADDAYDTGIGTQFSAETNIGDTDEQMMKYIEEKMSQRKGLETNNEEDANKYLSPEEAAILSLPAHLRETSTKKSEEMLSNQMLNGIPEINLGIEAKIRNIEATEEAKQKIINDQKNKKELPSHFVPRNFAVNFVQHHRFDIDQQQEQKKKQGQNEEKPNTKAPKRATDDYHFDKFRKQFRK
ncbi:hypothetical protein PVAND_005329 [Polypedilum vanderplanki]|uniref:Hepatocellular carcinoma-associated antigen 59 n=1 Tax=Polypedilum vanderplanki TaxID=319348 RepID=A0A9J6C031_POLVA|nr:hypothetical protein PVAND_005329 [Polypedilum vanderplanki]